MVLPLQSQTVRKRQTLTILVQIEYGKFSKKTFRHKDFPRDMQESYAESMVGDTQQDVSQTR